MRLPFALLGLMRLEQKNGWRADYRRARFVSVSLGHDTSFLRHMGSKRMVEIVGIFQRVRENEFGSNFPVKRRQFIKNAVLCSHRVVAHVEENRLRAEYFRRACSFLFSVGLNLFHRHPRLPPEFRRFASFPERETNHGDLPAALRV